MLFFINFYIFKMLPFIKLENNIQNFLQRVFLNCLIQKIQFKISSFVLCLSLSLFKMIIAYN